MPSCFIFPYLSQDANEIVRKAAQEAETSGTPSTVPTSCGTAEMLFFGIEHHEKKLEDLLVNHNENVMVLFPSSNPPAITGTFILLSI